MMLHTGGKSGVGKQGLFALTATATERVPVPITGEYHQAGIVDGSGVPNDQITVGGQQLGSDGIAWKVYPDGKVFERDPASQRAALSSRRRRADEISALHRSDHQHDQREP